MKRREFIALLGGTVAAWPLMARAQPADRVRRIGVLMGVANDAEGEARVAAFRQGLQQLGWVEGRNVLVEYQWGGGDPARLKIQAAEVAAMMPDVILAGGTAALVPMQQETRSIPIVFVGSADPVGRGFVASRPRPGGNMTGFTIFEVSLVGKMLEALKQIAPGIARVVLIYSPTNSNAADYWRSLETVAPTLAVKPVAAPVRDADEIERVCAALEMGRARRPGCRRVLSSALGCGGCDPTLLHHGRHRAHRHHGRSPDAHLPHAHRGGVGGSATGTGGDRSSEL